MRKWFYVLLYVVGMCMLLLYSCDSPSRYRPCFISGGKVIKVQSYLDFCIYTVRCTHDRHGDDEFFDLCGKYTVGDIILTTKKP